MNSSTLIDTIRYAREERNLTQKEVAERSGVALAYVCDIELGKKMPSINALIKIAAAVGYALAITPLPIDEISDTQPSAANDVQLESMATGYMPNNLHGEAQYQIERQYRKPLETVLREQWPYSSSVRAMAVRFGVHYTTMYRWLKTFKVGPYQGDKS